MVFTAAQRAAIAENEPSWLFKLRIRAILSLFLLIPLGCIASVLAYSSNFQSPAFVYDTRIWPCIVLIILSWIWDATTVAIYTKWKRPLNPLVQLLAHGLLTLLFIIVGAVSTHNAATASSIIHNDPYAPAPGANNTLSEGGYTTKADNGSVVLVTSANEKSCPAFADCAAQAGWMQAVEQRSSVAIAGCALFLLLMPVHLLLTALFIRDYRARLWEQHRLGSGEFHMQLTPDGSRSPAKSYGDVKSENHTTSQVYLLREGRGGLGFHKPHYANDSVLSIATAQTTSPTRPSTATTTRSRARFMRPKSTGPSLPLAFPVSRQGSKASTIASRRRPSNASTIASRRRKSADPLKDLPPVPTIDTSLLRVSTSDSLPPLTPDTAILTRSPVSPPHTGELSGPYPYGQGYHGEPHLAPHHHKREKPKQKQSPPALEKPSPPKLSIFPTERPMSPSASVPPKKPVMVINLDNTGRSSPATTLRSPTTPAFKVSFEDAHSRDHFDPDEISALPAIPPEGIPRMSRESSRPVSPIGGLGDLDMLRSLRSTLFASDGDNRRSRSSAASGSGSHRPSSPFGRSPSPSSFLTGNSGRQSPWSARKERRELLKEIENEREQRERELLDAEQRAHRAAEKMESAYLRDEMQSADEKAAMRKKRIEDRIQQLKDTLEELKRVQDEEERRAEERAEQRAEEDRRDEEEFQRMSVRYGSVDAARSIEHQRQDSSTQSIAANNTVAGSRPTTIGGETRPSTRGTDVRPATATSDGKGKEKRSYEGKRISKALPPVPPTVEEEGPADSTLRYSWETGLTVAHVRRDAPG